MKTSTNTISNMNNIQDLSVYELVTELCNKAALKYCTESHIRVSQKQLQSKLRSRSYELILRKSNVDLPQLNKDPISELLSYYFVSQTNVKNVAEYKKSIQLKNVINNVRQMSENVDNNVFKNILTFLVLLKDTVKADLSQENFQSPFTFGLLDEMLPRPSRELFGSPQPYQYYPSHVFQLPFSVKNHGKKMNSKNSLSYTEYTVETFDSRSFLPKNTQTHMCGQSDTRTFASPMSIASLISTNSSPYVESTNLAFPRLTTPRDLLIPNLQSVDGNVKEPLIESVKSDIKEVYRAHSDEVYVDIWEIASRIDRDPEDNIWEIVCKLPPVKERQLISNNIKGMNLWHHMYSDMKSDLNVISEKQFIRHVMFLTIGIETSSFPYNPHSNCFIMRENLIIEGVSKESIKRYVTNLLLIGAYYRRLFNFAFNQTLEDHLHSNGLIYESAREVVRRYLLKCRLIATEVYDDCFTGKANELNCMPTLLKILHHLEPVAYEIETIATIFKLNTIESSTSIPRGAELMSYLFNEISHITHKNTALTMFNSLIYICKVYFKFIERFIFDGELDDKYQEFFIKKDMQYVNCRSKRYWDKGFHITQSVAVPNFLKIVAKCILLCGKSLRLLKLCNPNDPLLVLISSDRPSVKCCSNFEELEQQQQVLDVYRTRCLFVSGEPTNFQQILLKREAERKAFAEIASIKQAETMEKIIAERKRLAQLIIAEKQHSLRVLEAAMAEAKAAKSKNKRQEKLRLNLEHAVEKSREEVDSKLRDEEKNKIMEYYSKLNMEVEKSKIHSEWKMKRLQLDQSRIQLLSSEERNLKREKLELEHQRNEEIMAMSIQSLGGQSDYNDESESLCEGGGKLAKVEDDYKVTNEMYNVTKGMSSDNRDSCDNRQKVDIQGNIVNFHSEMIIDENNGNEDTIDGDKKLQATDNYDEYLKRHNVCMINKQKAMSHTLTDNDNNTTVATIDNENNIEGIKPDLSNPFEEAKRNKIKVLGTEMGTAIIEAKVETNKPLTDAQREAVRNKQRVLGTEYDIETPVFIREPQNVAQEEAIRNRTKVLGSQSGPLELGPRRQSVKRSALTLNLQPCTESVMKNMSQDITPLTGGVTPGEIFGRLDLETPTTADIPPESQFSSDLFTPASITINEESNLNESTQFLTQQDFDFSTLLVEEVEDELTVDSNENSPYKLHSNKELWPLNEINGNDEFDPFGINLVKKFSQDCLSENDNPIKNFSYTHPADIMREVKKKPYMNIFKTKEDNDEEKVVSDNIATLTACLQRSVMLPLTYQLEVVNNSILTYFLVNLEMYDHLRSLKDYFFLMDGEFSKTICDNLFAKLTKTINPQELLNFATLHTILDKALGSSISHVHKFSENLSFTISEVPLSFHHSSPDVLQCLSLTYSVGWPLNIILSQEALVQYSKVFQFFLKINRISWVLGQDFETLKLSSKLLYISERRVLLSSPQYRWVSARRHVLASLIRALQSYMSGGCAGSVWRDFQTALNDARTLDHLYQCHATYLKAVLFRCLLNNRSTPIMKFINNIFTVILKFSRVLRAGEWEQKEEEEYFTHPNFIQLEELFHLFEKLTSYLHKLINRLMECGYQRHLVELLTLINLNGYYDPNKSKDVHSSSVQLI